MRVIAVAFVAGFASVLVFHQFGFWVLNEMHYARVPLYNMRPVPPFGVPMILSLAFWGGLWGIAADCTVRRLPGALGGVLGWVLFAMIPVTLVNWFIVLPLKGAAVGGGFYMRGILIGLFVYALWGLGMWLIATALRRLMKKKWGDVRC
jgi:hypothetical protein